MSDLRDYGKRLCYFSPMDMSRRSFLAGLIAAPAAVAAANIMPVRLPSVLRPTSFTLYVDQAFDGLVSDGSALAPFRTIGEAMKLVRQNAETIIQLASGMYQNETVLAPPSSEVTLSVRGARNVGIKDADFFFQNKQKPYFDIRENSVLQLDGGRIHTTEVPILAHLNGTTTWRPASMDFDRLAVAQTHTWNQYR